MISSKRCGVLMVVATGALVTAGCASFLDPRLTPDPENLGLAERRARNPSIVADPDPATLSAWTFGTAAARTGEQQPDAPVSAAQSGPTKTACASVGSSARCAPRP
jgi:hypothetical protein